MSKDDECPNLEKRKRKRQLLTCDEVLKLRREAFKTGDSRENMLLI